MHRPGVGAHGWLQALTHRLEAWAHRAGIDRIAYRVSRYGPRGLRTRYRQFQFDRRLGVHTRGFSPGGYEPTPTERFEEMMADLPTPPDGFVFVDFGSGKGKVLLLAARYPFRRIVGVEVSPDLHRAALENVRRHASTAAGLPPIECLSMDAASFAIPDEPAVFYFFDPFPEEVLASVLQNIQRSLDRLQRPVFLLFYSPARRGAPWDRRRLCDEAPFLRLVRDEATYGVYAGG